MDKICESNRCYGCGLCADICRVNAIEMRQSDGLGHFRPVVDPAKCIDCDLCRKKCPANLAPAYHENLITYAAWQTDPQKQQGSSSGGVAAALYETAVSKGYLIAGTVQNRELTAEMVLGGSPDDIERFRGSKYVQADTAGVYRAIRAALKQGKQVLFIGTPCQCEAARSAAGADADRMLTVDLICHGVPSQKILTDYIAWIGSRTGKPVDALSFRSDWGEEMQMFSRGKRIWDRRMYWDYYLELFNYGYIVNEACFACPYACDKRTSDLTIGDFWGIGKTVPFKSPKRSVSVVGVNTEKGRAFLDSCGQLTKVRREWSEAVAGNSQLKAPQKKSEQYELFRTTYAQKDLDAAIRATVYEKITARYKKEYPSFFIKSRIKSAAKKILGR